MYLPEQFEERDPAAIRSLLSAHGFGVLVTVDEGAPVANHLPLLHRPHEGALGTLFGHVAAANPLAKQLANRRVLVIFLGPHGYISPSYYETSPSVPTWNYRAVHVHGVMSPVDAAEFGGLLDEMVAHYEAGLADPWSARSLPVDFRKRLEREIVGFRIAIERVEAKSKLGQNRDEVDRRSAIAHLRALGQEDLAAAMEDALRRS
jgi:transcriptional regulator